jgi:hypothetical protein
MSRKHCRTRVRSRGKVVLNAYSRMVAHFAYAQLSENWREWKFRTISERQAEQLVAAGEAERITQETHRTITLSAGGTNTVKAVEVVGYRALSPTSWERPLPAMLTFGTMRAVAKRALGETKSGGERLSRRERDELNRFDVWALIGDDKAVAVRPRTSAAYMRRALSLMPEFRTFLRERELATAA